MKKKSIELFFSFALILLSPPVFAIPSGGEKPDEPSPDNKVNIDYTHIQLNTLTHQDIANYLGWVPKPDLRCHGFYQESATLYKEKSTIPFNQSPLNINADWSKLSQVGTSILLGDVIINQPERQLSADKVFIYRNKTTSELEYADLFGNVYYREPNRLIVGDKAEINLQEKSGTLYHTLYRQTVGSLKQKTQNGANREINDGQVAIKDLSAWGSADKMTRDKEGIIDIYEGTYSTCPPQHGVWTVKANHLNLNQDSGRGSATHAWLYVKDTPLLYFPYLNFPIDDRRKTGFLLPSIGTSTESGFSIATPFYWNIAPNYDATITPDYMERRGLQLNGEFRYLTEISLGNIHGSILPQDHEFNHFRQHLLNETAFDPTFDVTPFITDARERLEDTGDNRYLISWNDVRKFDPHWSSYIYLNRVSDDYYFQDFSNDPMETSENQIYNVAEVKFEDTHWNFLGRMEGYQTLHPLDQNPVVNQYQKLPELILNGSYPEAPNHLAFQFNNSAVYFNKTTDLGFPFDPVMGSRINVNPAVSMPRYWMAGFINPQIQMAATQYNLKNQNANLEFLIDYYDNPIITDALSQNFKQSDITRVLPIANVDAGLFFDRSLTLFSHSYQHTLEPRLFYLYVPYHNQNDIPYFDTILLPFTYDQLFRVNRFTGLDRIGDANQVSLALTSRLLEDETGLERVRASIGEIFYFSNRRVLAPQQLVNANNIITLNNPDPTAPTSPLAGQLLLRVNPAISVISNLTWDPNNYRQDIEQLEDLHLDTTHRGGTLNGSLTFQYIPDNEHIINFSYVYLKGGDPINVIDRDSPQNNLYQTDVSVLWPLFRNWSGVARWNYNISHRFTQNALAGLQYDSCCFAIRLLGGRQFDYQDIDLLRGTSRPTFNNQIYLELALKGLGNINNKSPHQVLTESVRGYQDTFGIR